MKDFHLCGWLLCYDLSKISAKLVISLKHNIIFAKFIEILLNNNVTSSHTHICRQNINHSEVIWVYIFRFFIKGTISPKCFWKHSGKNSTRLGFRWLTKSIETIQLYKRSFCRRYPCVFIFLWSYHWKSVICIIKNRCIIIRCTKIC